jgi:hypothetical protein
MSVIGESMPRAISLTLIALLVGTGALAALMNLSRQRGLAIIVAALVVALVASAEALIHES